MSNCSTGFDAKYLLLVLYLVGVNVTAVFMSDRMIRLKLTSLFCSLIMRCLAFVKKKKKFFTIIKRWGRCQSFMFGLMWKLGCKSRYFRNQLFPISWLISCTRRFITSSYLLPSLNLFILCFCMHLPAVVNFFSNTKWRGIMGNTSDRVAADRHGAKAHRSDSSGHKDHEPSSKMVDSTDDPNIFNTHGPESKVLLQNTTPFLQQPFSKNSPSRR